MIHSYPNLYPNLVFARSFRPQIVREKMICHSIIGNSIGKEVIMKVNIKAEFISPLLQFSERKINFCVLKVCVVLYISCINVSRFPGRIDLVHQQHNDITSPDAG